MIYHIVSVSSSADGHLGYFYFLAIMSKAAMNIQVLTGYVFSFLLGTYLGVKLLDYILTLCLTF